MKNLEAVCEAMTWLGTPYHRQGCVRGVGVDCGTLICEVYEKVGLMDHLDPRPYPPDWHMHQLGQRYLEHVLPCFGMVASKRLHIQQPHIMYVLQQEAFGSRIRGIVHHGLHKQLLRARDSSMSTFFRCFFITKI